MVKTWEDRLKESEQKIAYLTEKTHQLERLLQQHGIHNNCKWVSMAEGSRRLGISYRIILNRRDQPEYSKAFSGNGKKMNVVKFLELYKEIG